MKLIKLLSLTLLLLASAVSAVEKPNVILIYADDLGLGMLGHHGQQIVQTPNIDTLAKKGMRFTNYYGATFCAPARWTLLTGLHDGRMGSGSHTGGKFIVNLDSKIKDPAQREQEFARYTQEREKKVYPKEGELFLAQVAQQAGYQTAQFGKLDVGFLTWNRLLQRHGWDYHLGYYDHNRAHGFYPTYLWENGKKLPLKGNTSVTAAKMSEFGTEPVGSGGQTYSQNVFIEKMLTYIREHKDKPFFIYHPTQLPHGPVAIPELNPLYKDRTGLTLSEKKYASMISMLDDHVGLILNELKAQGILEKTLVIFTSDNGHESYYANAKNQLPKRNNNRFKLANGEKANFTDKKWRTSNGGDTFNGAAGYAGLKWGTFEGGIHCPFIAYWPGKIKPGSSSDVLATHYDFMPTLAQLLGVDTPKGKDGLSYLNTLLGQPQTETHDWIFIRGSSKTRSTLISGDGFKLLKFKSGDWHLYDLNRDPKEYKNVIQQYPERVKEMKKIFLRELNSPRKDI